MDLLHYFLVIVCDYTSGKIRWEKYSVQWANKWWTRKLLPSLSAIFWHNFRISDSSCAIFWLLPFSLLSLASGLCSLPCVGSAICASQGYQNTRKMNHLLCWGIFLPKKKHQNNLAQDRCAGCLTAVRGGFGAGAGCDSLRAALSAL